MLKLLFSVLASFSIAGAKNASMLKIIFLDVGQGDAVLFMFPDGGTFLIDGGPNTDADWILQDYISKYFCRLNMVLLTHPDADHVSGLVRVAEHCYIDMTFHNYVSHNSDIYSRWLEVSARGKNTHLHTGDSFSVSGVNFYVLWPPKDLNDKDSNDHSISLFIDYGNFEALFMGDLENARHAEVLKGLGSHSRLIERPFDLLKATHHGAENGLDESLVSWVKPEVFVISVGEDNTYGHPSPKVLDFMEALGAKIFRTDRDGTIEISIK